MKFFVLIIVVIGLVFVSRLLIQNLSVPTHLGHKEGRLAAMPDKPNAVSSQTDINDKRVEALPFKGNALETMNAVLATFKAMGGNEIKEQQSDYVYSVFTTSKLRFHDDVEVLLDEQAQLVHFRSQSRAGHSDLGVNRQRYMQFKKIYQQQ